MTMLASSTSWCCTVSSARPSASTTMSSPPRACCSSSSSWFWNSARVVSGIALAHLSGDVGLGALVGRVGEDRVRVVELDDVADPVAVVLEHDREEGRLVGDTRRLLHVVGDDHDRVVLTQLDHQVLDLA